VVVPGHVRRRRQQEIDATDLEAGEVASVTLEDQGVVTDARADVLDALREELDRDRLASHPVGNDRRRSEAREGIEHAVAASAELGEAELDE
jgi:hypothetical protein